ncbi:hypothetical protein DFJ73DRAFT_963077 [Zopfochytrium polystomum]|nr:hypothetical protein DFJ73DRAFT_963077 [Zopfochytrium polystomum]
MSLEKQPNPPAPKPPPNASRGSVTADERDLSHSSSEQEEVEEDVDALAPMSAVAEADGSDDGSVLRPQVSADHDNRGASDPTADDAHTQEGATITRPLFEPTLDKKPLKSAMKKSRRPVDFAGAADTPHALASVAQPIGTSDGVVETLEADPPATASTSDPQEVSASVDPTIASKPDHHVVPRLPSAVAAVAAVSASETRPQTPPRTSSWANIMKKRAARTSFLSVEDSPTTNSSQTSQPQTKDLASSLWSTAASFASSISSVEVGTTPMRRLSATAAAIAAATTALSERLGPSDSPSKLTSSASGSEPALTTILSDPEKSVEEPETTGSPKTQNNGVQSYPRRIRRVSSASLRVPPGTDPMSYDETLVESSDGYVVRTTDLARMLTASGKEDSLTDDQRKRNNDFHDLFPAVSRDQLLVEEFPCAWQREVLLQGRLYVCPRNICFNANLFGWNHSLNLEIDDIVSVEKRNVAGLIPNAIELGVLTGQKYFFASFMQRDYAYDTIFRVWGGPTKTVRLLPYRDGRFNEEDHASIYEASPTDDLIHWWPTQAPLESPFSSSPSTKQPEANATPSPLVTKQSDEEILKTASIGNQERVDFKPVRSVSPEPRVVEAPDEVSGQESVNGNGAHDDTVHSDQPMPSPLEETDSITTTGEEHGRGDKLKSAQLMSSLSSIAEDLQEEHENGVDESKTFGGDSAGESTGESQSEVLNESADSVNGPKNDKALTANSHVASDSATELITMETRSTSASSSALSSPTLTTLFKSFGQPRIVSAYPVTPDDPLQAPVYTSPLSVTSSERRLSSVAMSVSKGLADLASSSSPSLDSGSSPSTPSFVAFPSQHIVFQKHPVLQAQVKLDIANRPRSIGSNPDKNSRPTSPTVLTGRALPDLNAGSIRSQSTPNSPLGPKGPLPLPVPPMRPNVKSSPETITGKPKTKVTKKRPKAKPAAPIQTESTALLPAVCPCAADHAAMTSVFDKVLPVSLAHLWDLMFGSTPDTHSPMHRFLTERRKCSNLTGTVWNPTKKPSSTSTSIPSSLSSSRVRLSQVEAGATRTTEYLMSLSNPMGPKSTRSQGKEIIRNCGDGFVCVDQSTVTPDVPSGNAFVTNARICFTRVGLRETRVRASCGVEFSKFTWLQAIIQTAAPDGLRAHFKDFELFLREILLTDPEPPPLPEIAQPLSPKASSETDTSDTEATDAEVAAAVDADDSASLEHPLADPEEFKKERRSRIAEKGAVVEKLKASMDSLGAAAAASRETAKGDAGLDQGGSQTVGVVQSAPAASGAITGTEKDSAEQGVGFLELLLQAGNDATAVSLGSRSFLRHVAVVGLSLWAAGRRVRFGPPLSVREMWMLLVGVWFCCAVLWSVLGLVSSVRTAAVWVASGGWLAGAAAPAPPPAPVVVVVDGLRDVRVGSVGGASLEEAIADAVRKTVEGLVREGVLLVSGSGGASQTVDVGVQEEIAT